MAAEDPFADLDRWLERVADVFARPEPRLLLEQMTVGLLSPLPAKNGRTLAEHAGHGRPGRVQTFLCRGAWDAGLLERRVRDMVLVEFGDPEGILVVDETRILKKGRRTVGVAPQRCPASGRIENCQVVVSLAYAGRGGSAFIGYRLHLPALWTGDPVRCRTARIPPEVGFATLGDQAVQLLVEADAAGVPYGWVAVGVGPGRHRQVRDHLTLRGRPYVAAVSRDLRLAAVHGAGSPHDLRRVGDLVERTSCDEVPSRRQGTGTDPLHGWECTAVALPDEPPAEGFEHILLFRRAPGEPERASCLLAHAPRDTRSRDMVWVAGHLPPGGGAEEPGRSLVGLGSHQVRTWTAFHHHVAVCLFAHAFASARRSDRGN